MDLFSPLEVKPKPKPKPKPKAKVAPMPNNAAAAAAVAAPRPPPRIIPWQERYNIGFAPNRPMSNSNKAALAARRRTMRSAAGNYGNAAAAGGAGRAVAATPRPVLNIPNNNAVHGAAAAAPYSAQLHHNAAFALGGGVYPYVGHFAAPNEFAQYGMMPVEKDEHAGVGVVGAAAAGNVAPPAAGNGFVNVNLGGGGRRRSRRTRRRPLFR